MGLRVSLLETRVPLLCTWLVISTGRGNSRGVNFTAIGSQKTLPRTRDVSPVWLGVNLKCDWSKNISLLLKPWETQVGS